ncbi:MAG: transposase, partial [Burkholderiales bacterium PBB5]
PADRRAALDAAMRQGWALGDAAFLGQLAQQLARPVQPRPRGRPPKAPA